MTEKCDINGCAMNVEWEIEWKILSWHEARLCELHKNAWIKNNLDCDEMKIKRVER